MAPRQRAHKDLLVVLSTRTACPLNTFSASPGSSSCTPCPAGKETLVDGRSSLFDCYGPHAGPVRLKRAVQCGATLADLWVRG